MSSEILVLPFLDFQEKVKFFISQKHIQNISDMIWVEGNTSKAKPSLKIHRVSDSIERIELSSSERQVCCHVEPYLWAQTVPLPCH